ncbi:MAG: FliI/YscN family ATPase [Acidobacteriota bacterium]
MADRVIEKDYLALGSALERVAKAPAWDTYGKVIQLTGNLIEAEGLQTALGDICKIHSPEGGEPIYAEVVGFERKRLKLSPLTPLSGIRPGNLVQAYNQVNSIPVCDGLLGRILDGMGRPMDDKGPIVPTEHYPLYGRITNPLDRPIIGEQLDVGVRSINNLLPLGKGQRIGIFAGSGVGKSTLLGMMARYTTAPVNVIALIGERGREVNEFIEHELGPEGKEHSVVIVATSDQPATVRIRGAYMACAIAEYFMDRGRDVLLMMDSVTRFAMAAREVGLAAGEPPTTKGYTPSVFAQLPRLLERAGSFGTASITGIYTVLVEGDDMEDPIADTVRSILDGHIVLDRALAQKRHFPAINILKSVSRLTDRLLTKEQKELVAKFTRTMANYKNSEDMIRIGAYVKGSHPETDYAIAMIERLNEYLRQPVEESCSIDDGHAIMKKLFS